MELYVLIFAVLFTLGVSAFCSLLEAMILSTTTAEIESLKQRMPKRGELLEKFKNDIETTSSAILGLNTVANTAGASISGALFAEMYPEQMWIFSAALVVGILVLSEIIPKNIGVLYRPGLQPIFIYPLQGVRIAMWGISWVAKSLLRLLTGKRAAEETGDEEIILLAEKSAKEGNLTRSESAIITNALSLDEVRISEIMTPRTVVHSYDCQSTIGEVFAEQPNIPFARMPIYQETIDDVVGMVRRRDLLKAKADGRDGVRLIELVQKTTFLPENTNAANALQQFLKSHQQLAVVVDEYGSVSGVVTMEDVMEHILGQEIFENDDMAVDMREFAKRKNLRAQENDQQNGVEFPLPAQFVEEAVPVMRPPA